VAALFFFIDVDEIRGRTSNYPGLAADTPCVKRIRVCARSSPRAPAWGTRIATGAKLFAARRVFRSAASARMKDTRFAVVEQPGRMNE
jgi:hypothetical protein